MQNIIDLQLKVPLMRQYRAQIAPTTSGMAEGFWPSFIYGAKGCKALCFEMFVEKDLKNLFIEVECKHLKSKLH